MAKHKYPSPRLTPSLLLIPLVFFFCFANCKIADLRPPALEKAQGNKDLETKAKRLIEEPAALGFAPGDWKKIKQVQFTLVDSWHSRLVRFFTPIPTANQKLKVHIHLEKDTIVTEFLDGPKKGLILGLEKKEPFQIADDTGKVFTGDNEVRIYLESLRFYLLLVWNLRNYPILQYAGDKQRLGQDYSLVFATKGKPEPHPENDQILAYFEKQNGALVWVDFTYREVMQSYQGVLKLGTYEDWNGRFFPKKISILGSAEDSDYVHELQIERIEIPKLPLAEEPTIQELN